MKIYVFASKAKAIDFLKQWEVPGYLMPYGHGWRVFVLDSPPSFELGSKIRDRKVR